MSKTKEKISKEAEEASLGYYIKSGGIKRTKCKDESLKIMMDSKTTMTVRGNIINIYTEHEVFDLGEYIVNFFSYGIEYILNIKGKRGIEFQMMNLDFQTKLGNIEADEYVCFGYGIDVIDLLNKGMRLNKIKNLEDIIVFEEECSTTLYQLAGLKSIDYFESEVLGLEAISVNCLFEDLAFALKQAFCLDLKSITEIVPSLDNKPVYPTNMTGVYWDTVVVSEEISYAVLQLMIYKELVDHKQLRGKTLFYVDSSPIKDEERHYKLKFVPVSQANEEACLFVEQLNKITEDCFKDLLERRQLTLDRKSVV